LGLCLLIFVGPMFADPPLPAGAVKAATVPPPAAVLPTKMPVAVPARVEVGTEFTLGDYSYTVDSVAVKSKIGRGYGKKKASKGAAFVIIEYSIKNLGKETSTVLADDFELVDAKDRRFRSSSDLTTALIMAGNPKDLFISELQPGLSREMTTGFEVPKDALDGELTLVVPEKGWLGSKKVSVALGVQK
jgi:hypothetical protein